VLQHLGAKPGSAIELQSSPGGKGVMQAARPAGWFYGFVGLLAGCTSRVAALAAMDEAVAVGRAAAALLAGHGRRAPQL